MIRLAFKYLTFSELSKNRKLIHLSIPNIHFFNKTDSSNQRKENSYPDFPSSLTQNQAEKIYKIKKISCFPYAALIISSSCLFLFLSCILSILISLLFLSLLIFSFCNALHLVEKEHFKSHINRSTKPFNRISFDWQITLLRPYSFHIKNRKT